MEEECRGGEGGGGDVRLDLEKRELISLVWVVY